MLPQRLNALCLLFVLGSSTAYWWFRSSSENSVRPTFPNSQQDLGADSPKVGEWTQWGGEQRSFRVQAKIDRSRPPSLVWRRGLGKGHAAIVANNEFAFVFYRNKQAEIIEKISLRDGRPQWQKQFFDRKPSSENNYPGPHSTPILFQQKLFCVSTTGELRCLRQSNGDVLWTSDLKTFGMQVPQSGYAASPLIYQQTLIVPTLGNASPAETEYFRDPRRTSGNVPGAIGFDCDTGKVIWKTRSFRSSHSSPVLIKHDQTDTAVFHGMFELVGLDPANGNVRWRFLLRNLAADNVAFTPIWDSHRQQMIVSHGYCDQGTQAVSITQEVSKFDESPWQLKCNWKNSKLRVNHTNAVICGNQLIGSNRSPSTLLTALDLKTGKVTARRRGFRKANLLAVGKNVLTLEDDGKLSLLDHQLEPVFKGHPILEGTAWTVPTLIDHRLLARDDQDIKLFEFKRP